MNAGFGQNRQLIRAIHDERISEALPAVGRLQEPPTSWQCLEEYRPSAVLCLFIPPSKGHRHSHANVVLTQRSVVVRTHKGQIGFPGGRAESIDPNPIATALREAQEEIGLDPEDVKIHGCLPWARGLDGKLIIPILGSAPIDISSLTANQEVSKIIPVPWLIFRQDQAKRFQFTMFGTRRESFLYQFEGHHIWGLTATMLHEAAFQISSNV